MKFTKEQLLEALKAKLTTNGKNLTMSQKTLTSQVETLYALGVSEDTELDAFVAKVLPSLESLEGNYRKDNSEFIKKWEKEHPKPEPDPTLPIDKKGKESENKSDDEKIDLLLKEIQALKADRENEKKQKAISDKKSTLITKLKEKGIKDDAWISEYLADTSISDETDIDTKLETALKIFNKASAGTDPNITPLSPGGNPPQKEDFADIVAKVKRDRHIDNEK